MPIYEYVCDECGETTEALRSLKDADAPIACERCGGKKTQRVQSAFNAAKSNGGSNDGFQMGGGCGCGNPNGPCGR